MMRFNGLLLFNSFINSGEFIQPHFQKRKFLRYLSLKTPSGQYRSLYTYSPLLSPICIYYQGPNSYFGVIINSGEYIYMHVNNIYCHHSTMAVYAKIYLAISEGGRDSDKGLMNKNLKLILD